MLADGVLIWKVSLSKRLVDNGYGRTAAAIAFLKPPARNHGRLHGLEVSGTGSDKERVVACRKLLAHRHRGLGPHSATQRSVSRDTRGDDSGHALHGFN